MRFFYTVLIGVFALAAVQCMGLGSRAPLLFVPHAAAQQRAPFTPTVPEEAVRQWFKAVSFRGFRQVSLYHEFQPIDGNLVARYEGTGENTGKVVYLSFIDNVRKDPTYGFRRDARTMAQIGAKYPPQSKTINGHKWYGNDTTPSPLATADVSKEVKVMLMGYANATLGELFVLAGSLSFEILEKAHRNEKE